jgi:hypothetical protein
MPYAGGISKMAKKCCESVNIKSQWGTQSVRCPKNAVKFFHLEYETRGERISTILGCCEKHARGKTTSKGWEPLLGLFKSPVTIVKSSEQELLQHEQNRKHESLLKEFQAMLSRPVIKDKTREEIMEIFTRALDEHCVKQVINS